ncbi:hypothetical protein IHE55_22025 [Streptomyces pactum]|uniref:Translation initiation factor IF-2 n=1 Tax=Streptomyces pactum TaxID=68249 RepID=A0ABS0NQ58_9ACTN|nr:hypothetical protein [Streptomyces pactum]MBH5337291.1 hypothetical protein [Streptomyces pactum]
MGEFDGKSMAELHAMLAGSDATALTGAGEALSAASPRITAIGEGLKRYASRVEWKGRANDAFREWTHDFSLEVLRLAEFTDAVGTRIAEAGGALALAKKAIPTPVDAAGSHGDPDLGKALKAEAGKLNEAVHQMEKLSSVYTVTREDLTAQKEPRFRPLPGGSRRADAIGPVPVAGAPDTGGSTAPASPHGTPTSTAGFSNGAVGPRESLVAPQVPVGAPPERGSHHRMEIDSVEAPPAPLAPGSERLGEPSTGTETTASRNTSFPAGPPVTAPLSGDKGVPGRGAGGPSYRPPAGGSVKNGQPVRPPFPPRATAGRDIVGGSPPPATTSPPRPRGVVAGEGQAHPSRGGYPATGYPGPPVGAAGAPGPGAARAVPGSGAPAPAPRSAAPGSRYRGTGAAIGEEASGRPRGPVGHALSGSPASPRSGSSRTRNRFLSCEPGGAVVRDTGRPPLRTAYTPGGSGLVRDEPTGEAEPRGGRTARHANADGTKPRPEVDEWGLARRNTVPPVIG